jgi:hypothetical protein
MSQKYAAYNKSGSIIGFYDNVDSPVPSGVSAIKVTDAEWQTCLSTPGYTVVNSTLTAPLPPTAAEKLANAQKTQIETISTNCASSITAGFTSSALGAANTYPSTLTDQHNLNGSVVASLLPNLPSTWTTKYWVMDSSGVWTLAVHTAAQIQQAGLDGKAWVTAQQEKLASLLAQVMAAMSVADVQAIVW